jgi:hypothetical protein
VLNYVCCTFTNKQVQVDNLLFDQINFVSLWFYSENKSIDVNLTEVWKSDKQLPSSDGVFVSFSIVKLDSICMQVCTLYNGRVPGDQIGRFFAFCAIICFGRFFHSRNCANLWATFFHITYVFNLTQKRLGYTLGEFFYKLRGQSIRRRLWFKKSKHSSLFGHSFGHKIE